MKPATAAKKLGVYLPATPASFREGTVSRSELASLQADPPAWLVALRKDGPHPRPVVAQKLGISASGLARAGAPDVMTTDEIAALLREMPAWLSDERSRHSKVQEENARVKAQRRDREPRQGGV